MSETTDIMNRHIDNVLSSGPMRFIITTNALTPEQIEKLRSASEPGTEVITEEEYAKRVDSTNRNAFKPYKKELRALSFTEKMAWYSQLNSQELVFLGNNPYFQRYWKWHVLLPIKFKRFFYRLKNGELWKRYSHITDLPGKKKKKAGPERI